MKVYNMQIFYDMIFNLKNGYDVNRTVQAVGNFSIYLCGALCTYTFMNP